MREEYLEIQDLKEFVKSSRESSYKTVKKNLDKKTEITDVEQLLIDFFDITKYSVKDILTNKEVEDIIRSDLIERTDDPTLYFKKSNYRKYAESLCARLLYNMLHALAKMDILEVAFDSDTDGFIFWKKQHEKN